jgi:hypothetical protein
MTEKLSNTNNDFLMDELLESPFEMAKPQEIS